MDKRKIKKEISPKVVNIHAAAVLMVCLLFGVINLLQGNYSMGVVLIAMGVAIMLIAQLVMRRMPVLVRGVFLTQVVVVIITAVSSGKLYVLFTLLAANITIGCIYYSMINLYIVWGFTNLVTVGAMLLWDSFYQGADMNLVLKGIVGINVAAVLIRVLLKESIMHIAEAEEKTEQATMLTSQVQSQMKETRLLSEQQTETMEQVSDSAKNLEISSGNMLDVSNRLGAAVEAQSEAVGEIHGNLEVLLMEAKKSFEVAEESARTAVENRELLCANDIEIKQMMSAMQRVQEASAHINKIIKTIDDIAFQTNLLALNAAVEAARAGDAGKGFDVVAGEVRNLAVKSAQAAKETEEMILESISAINKGVHLAEKVAGQMQEMMTSSEKNEEQSKQMAEIVRHQQTAVTEIEEKVRIVSDIILQNTKAAEESTQIAQGVAEEVRNMNERVLCSR